MILLSIKKIAVTGTGSDRLLWKMMRSAIYVFKDSLSKIMRDSFLTKRNIDSLRAERKPITIKKIFWTGVSHNFYSHRSVKTYSLDPLLKKLQYNTVEGLSVHVNQSLFIRPVKSKYTYKLGWKHTVWI